MRKDEKRKLFAKKVLTILIMAITLFSVSFACGATAYAEAPTMIGEAISYERPTKIGEAAYYEAPAKIGDAAYTEEVYETEPFYEVPEEKEEDQTTVEDDPQAYRESLREDAAKKEEWKEFCQKWQNFKKFIREAVTILIQR